MAEQIIINVTDPIPNKNAGIVDSEQVIKAVYNKPQTDAKIADITANAASGIKGTATASNSPTSWTSGDPYLFEKYNVYEAGTYTNFKDASLAPIVVTSADLLGNFVFIEVTNGVAKKVMSSKPITDPTKIVTWLPDTFYSEKTQVIKDGNIYEVDAGVNGTATDIPGISPKWILKTGDLEINRDLFIKTRSLNKEGDLLYNSALETSIFIPLKNITVLSGNGRAGFPNNPLLTYFDANKVKISSVTGTSDYFKIAKADFPVGAEFVIINALSGTGMLFGKIEPQELQSLPTFSGYINTNGNVVADAFFKHTDFFKIPSNKNIDIYFTYTNGSGVLSVLFFDINKTIISGLSGYTVGEYSIGLTISNIPLNAVFIKINTAVDTVYVNFDRSQLLTDIATKESGSVGNFVEKEAGKGLSTNDYTSKDKSRVSKLVTDGAGTKVLYNDGSYKTVGSGGTVIEEANTDNFNIKNISASTPLPKKPTLVITFDDGNAADYTVCAPILSELGVNGTFYVNKLDIADNLTSAQVIEMSAQGHEFGSHTENHMILSAVAALAPILATDTEIKINSSYGYDRFLDMTGMSVLKMWCYNAGERVDFIITKTEVKNNSWYITLDKPIGFQLNVNTEFFVSEESALIQSLKMKEKLNSLGIECIGFAYPYGLGTLQNVNALKSGFNYARYAYGGPSPDFKIFGGIDEYGYNDLFDQFKIPAIELPVLSDAQIDDYLDEAELKNGVFCTLVHPLPDSNNGMYAKLRYVINQAKARGFEIKTMAEALETHGNLITIGDRVFNSDGEDDSVLPPNYYDSLENIYNLSKGITIRRVYEGSTTGYPEAGTLVTYNSSGKNSIRENWVFELFYGYQNNNIWKRRRTSVLGATEWICTNLRKGTTLPTTGIEAGSQFLRTSDNKTFTYTGSKWVDAMGVDS